MIPNSPPNDGFRSFGSTTKLDSSTHSTPNSSKQSSLYRTSLRKPKQTTPQSASQQYPLNTSGSSLFDTHGRPKLIKRHSHAGSYFNHEGSIQLSGSYESPSSHRPFRHNPHHNSYNSSTGYHAHASGNTGMAILEPIQSINSSNINNNHAYTYNKRSGIRDSMPNKSSGLLYSTKAKKELSSIDVIHDLSTNALVCAGKSHLGYYKFASDRKTIKCVHDIVKVTSNQASSFQPKRGRQVKFSTIADVKTGFFNYKHYAAICTNSTNISIFDVTRNQSYDSALITSLSEHTRSVNSFDFNMVQTNLILSGGQDGCIKIWDIRSNSAKKRSSGCDISINTAYESVRDTKWMPGYNFSGPMDKNSNELRSHSGYKFASIHDSGVLLKFDLRQPYQPEKKINAHTGPGLCLNWHPHQEYILSGGRDGKCCLWYFGDKTVNDFPPTTPTTSTNFSHQGLSPNYFSNTTPGALALAYPETTINIGSPITKLKFRPTYDNNIYNSLLAISAMGEEAQVSIYSLNRRFIPKYIFETSAPSMGLVWYDSDHIFNIDKDNFINGWDIRKEPSVLDNLSKITTSWRDIDGYGFTFVQQDIGGYETIDENDYPSDHSNERTSRNNQNISSVGFSTNTNSSTALLTNLKGSKSYYKGIERVKSPNSILSLPTNHSFNSVSMSSLNSSDSQIHEPDEDTSPYIVTLDLPYIFNGMRIKQLEQLQCNKISSNGTEYKDTPVETFKYLVRELQFSVEHQKREHEHIHPDNATEEHSNKLEEDREQKDLMERFGFSENSTWAALINKGTTVEKAIATNSSSTSSETEKISSTEHIPMNESVNTESKSVLAESESQNSSKKLPEHSKLSEALQNQQLDKKQKAGLLLKLVSVASHNALVYSNIEDLQNFKTWILIRDSLLWDMKSTDLLSELESSNNHQDEHIHKYQDSDFSETSNPHTRHFSMESGYSSKVITTDQESSFVEEHPQALRAQSEESNISGSSREKIESLRNELRLGNLNGQKSEREKYGNSETEENQINEHHSDNDEAIIEEDEDANERINRYKHVDDDFSEEAPTLGNFAKGVPILRKRNERLSFIDTFMSEARPSGIYSDENLVSRSRGSPSLGQSSPRSKISSLRSLTPNNHHTFMEKIMSQTGSPGLFDPNPNSVDNLLKTKNPKNNYFSNQEGFNMATTTYIDQLSNTFNDKGKYLANIEDYRPWNTKNLLNELYVQAVESGNTLLAINILLLFHNVFEITTEEVVKNSLAEFLTILHRFETFEIAAALVKHCQWEDIMGGESSQSFLQIYCNNCHELIINENSKEKFNAERIKNIKNNIAIDPMEKFGYWYCDTCKKANNLCVYCEQPIKKMSMGLLSCGHEGHFNCFKTWFLEEQMTVCPAGCNIELNI